jgi:5-dehydro-2-deoxygluconokinase
VIEGSATLRLLSIDHGAHDLEPVARAAGADPARLPVFKRLAVAAAIEVAHGRPGHGMFLDLALGRDALAAATAGGLWLARQYPHGASEAPAEILATWPVRHVVKAIVNARSDARTPIERRLPEVAAIAACCERSGHALLVEALPAPGQSIADLGRRLERSGIAPAWWLVEPQPTAVAWREASDGLATPGCSGVITIARSADVEPDFALAAAAPAVRGFVGGRSIFGAVLADWLVGRLGDGGAVAELARRYGAMCAAWDRAAQGGTA